MDQQTSTTTPPPIEPRPETGYVAPPAAVTPTAVALPALSRQAFLARIGLLGIAAAALVAAALLLLGGGASPLRTLAAGSDSGAANDRIDVLHRGPGLGFRGGHGFGPGGITISAISGNSISLETEDGWTRTITVDSGTTYSKGGDTIALGDLQVGDQIGFRQTREDDGSWTIDSIVVVLPHVGGEVTKVDGSTITVSQRDGTSATIKVNGQTNFAVNGDDSAALADVKVGMFLVAEGTKNTDGSITATQVRAVDPGEFDGPGGRPAPGFHFGHGPDDWNPDEPDSTAAPSGTGSAS